ncbi:MAG: hypothetical protein AAF724_16790 [Pseudomonadota bacterium]
MKRWICAFMLTICAVTFTVGAQAYWVDSEASATLNSAAASAQVAETDAMCCGDVKVFDKAAAPCSVDCSYLPAPSNMSTPGDASGYANQSDTLPSAAGVATPLRPPAS